MANELILLQEIKLLYVSKKICFMNTNRFSKATEANLNHEVKKEAEAAQIFLSYGCWADAQAYGRIANVLFRHSSEE